MKARLIPLYFEPGRDGDFDVQMKALHNLLADYLEILPPLPLGASLPEAEAVVFPQLLGEAYRHLDDFRAIDLPILIITSEFGTYSMWDWEIISYLKSEGVKTIAPCNLELSKKICIALGIKHELETSKFLVFQDDPGNGEQASIFKRFYWWEDECSQRMKDKFGLSIVKESFNALASEAKEISDDQAQAVWKTKKLPTENVSNKALNSALKMYIALKRKIDKDKTIKAVGINCLNESYFSDTTPCLALSMLYEEEQLIWGCEADTMAMLSEYLLKPLNASFMMTNLYPFLLGDAALKHEGIERFPEIDGDTDNHILVAHCGYVGLIPKCFSKEWMLRKKVLAIVDENATAIDAQFPLGEITLAKLHPKLDKIFVVQGDLKEYAQFPNSHCLNGGVIEVSNGRKLADSLVSHHYLMIMGHHLADIRVLGKIFGFEVEEI